MKTTAIASKLLNKSKTVMAALSYSCGEGLDHFNNVRRLERLRDEALKHGLEFIEKRGVLSLRPISAKSKRIAAKRS